MEQEFVGLNHELGYQAEYMYIYIYIKREKENGTWSFSSDLLKQQMKLILSEWAARE